MQSYLFQWLRCCVCKSLVPYRVRRECHRKHRTPSGLLRGTGRSRQRAESRARDIRSGGDGQVSSDFLRYWVAADDVSPGRHAQGRLLGEILGELLVKLGAPNSALRSLAYVQASPRIQA